MNVLDAYEKFLGQKPAGSTQVYIRNVVLKSSVSNK